MNIQAGRIVRFTMIVWGLALAFIVAEEGFSQAVAWMIAKGWVMNQAEQAGSDGSAQRCAAVSAAISNGGSALVDPPQTRAAMWLLGLRVGVLASLEGRLDPVPREQLAPLLNEIGTLAGAIGIATPTPFTVTRIGLAFSEFERFVTEDRNCAAAALQARLSARHAALYRFAALAGYSYATHQVLPDGGPLFAPQLRTFGAAAGVPDELVRRWVSPTASGGVAGMGDLVAQTGRAMLASP